MSTVLITGAGGFIARQLARSLAAEGWRVVGASRTAAPVDGFETVARCALGETLAPALSSGPIDAVVHTANAEGKDEYRLNVDGTTRWFREAEEAGVGLQILLSSLSANANAHADYGRAKFALESVFTDSRGLALRLGVVVGNGGMYERMRKSLSGPVAPLLDGGRARVHVLGIDYLCDVVRDLIRDDGDDRRGRVWRIQQPEAYSLRQVLDTIRRVNGLGCRFLSVPSLPILWMLSLAEKLPLSLPVNTTNIRGLRQSRHETFESDFDRFGYAAQSLEALIERAAQGD